MLNPTDPTESGALEECVDELDAFIAALDRFPDGVVALALRVHLGALLRTLVEQQLCSREDVRHFVLELEQEALGVGED